MSPPLAYLITWTTYGTWLPGDERGWVKHDEFGIHQADPRLKAAVKGSLSEAPVTLTLERQNVVEEAIVEHCRFRGWTLHAVNVRTNHVHLVVTAGADPDDVAEKLKSRCSRFLNLLPSGHRDHWWTRGQSTKWINDESICRTRFVTSGTGSSLPPAASGSERAMRKSSPDDPLASARGW